MSVPFTKRLHDAVPVLVLLCTGLLAATKIGDPDTMQYLASGRQTLQHGLERACVFSYASDQCQIVYPQWLFHVAAYEVYRMGSWNALVALQIAIAIGVFAVVAWRLRRARTHPLVIAAFVLFAAMVARERFILRADLFALLPAVLLYYVLERYWDPSATEASRRLLLPVLGGIQVVWANTHGSFPLAFVLLGAFLAESVLTRAPGVRAALEAGGVVVLASFLNPFGLEAFLQPFRFMLGGEHTAPQLEFLSPFAPADLEHLTVIAYKALLAAGVALLVLSFRAIRVRDLAILAAVTYLSVKGMRYLALFAVFCAALLPRYAEALRETLARFAERRGGERTPAAVGAAASVLIIAATAVIAHAAATNRLYRFDAISRRTGFGVSDLAYPAAAAEFVEKADLQGAMFNDYSIGTYLNWRLFPARKTFIDGHTYTPERLAYYRQVMAGGVPYQQVVDRYGVGYFLLSHRSSEARDLIARLYRDERFALVYLDEAAVVFLKKTPANEGLIERLRVDFAAFGQPIPAPLANVRDPDDAYLGRTDRGLALAGLGRNAEALHELEDAARENASSFVTLTALGLQLEQHGDAARALSACERAVRIRPGYAPGRFWLGILDLRRKRLEDGIAQLQATLRINPSFPLAHFNLGAAFENRGDKRLALLHYRQELAINPSYQPAQNGVKRLS